MKLKKCQDYLASQIRWEIELETRIPTTADVLGRLKTSTLRSDST
jgi:hypothetical protein